MHGKERLIAVVCGTLALGAGVTTSAVWGAEPGARSAVVRVPALPDFGRGPNAASGATGPQWRAIAKAFEHAGQTAAAGEGDGQAIVDAHGSYHSARWEFSLKMRRPTAAFLLGSPPGFDALGGGGLQFGFPAGSGWRFHIGGAIKGRARVKVGGTTIFSWSPTLRYSLSLPRLKLFGGLVIDASDPARPVVTSRRLGASGGLGLGGILSGLGAPLHFGSVDGAPALIAGAHGSLGTSGVGASFDGQASISFIPTRAPDLDLGTSDAASVAKSTFPDWLVVRLRLDGKASFKLKRIARRDAHLRLQYSWPVPSQRDFNNLLLILAGFDNFSLPRRWGDNPPSAYRVAPPPANAPYAGTALDLEDHILPHIPNGLVHSINRPGAGQTYTAEGDSAIHTGEYLAAEGFRYASTHDPRALQRVNDVLAGIDRLFWVTEDAAAAGKEITPNAYAPGTLSRTATVAPLARLPQVVVRRPAGRGRRPVARLSELPPATIAYGDGPLNRRGCYYLRPQGGWTVTVGRTRHHAGTYAAALQSGGRLARGTAAAKITPSGRVWYGFGCGGDRPISRDQYTGVFFGLGLAYKLVDDPGVRAHIRVLVDKALGYLQRNGWRILDPFESAGPCDDTVSTGTIQCELNAAKVRNLGSENFLLNFDDQAAFRRVGATADPGRWLTDYERAAPALAAPAWAGVYVSTLDPLFQYYKFNLAHEVLASLLFLENGDALRQLYYPAFDVLRGATRAHQNAYFDLLYLLVQPDALRGDAASQPSASNPSITLADEVRSILADWIVRRDAVQGPNHLPLLYLANPALVRGLWPGDVGLYTTIDFDPKCLSQWALPPEGRLGPHRDDLWEQQPFAVGVSARNCGRSPSLSDLQRDSSSGPYRSTREAPGVDYLLPYWMAVYLGILPRPG